jgi:hypothetical protein
VGRPFIFGPSLFSPSRSKVRTTNERLANSIFSSGCSDGNFVDHAAFAHLVDLFPAGFSPVEALAGLAEQLDARAVRDFVFRHDRAPQRHAVLTERPRRSALIDQLQQFSSSRMFQQVYPENDPPPDGPTPSDGPYGGDPPTSLAGSSFPR